MAKSPKKYASTGPTLGAGKKSRYNVITPATGPVTAEEAGWTAGHVSSLLKHGHLREAGSSEQAAPAASSRTKGKGKQVDPKFKCFNLDPKALEGKSVEDLQLIVATVAAENRLDEDDDFDPPQFSTVEEGIKYLSQAR